MKRILSTWEKNNLKKRDLKTYSYTYIQKHENTTAKSS